MWTWWLKDQLQVFSSSFLTLQKREKAGIFFVTLGLGILLTMAGSAVSLIIHHSVPETVPAIPAVLNEWSTTSSDSADIKDTAKPSSITVDVSGAVNAPGIYQLAGSDRMSQALMAAQGLSDKANSEYVAKQMNLAAKLVDGQKIYIPFIGEDIGQSVGSSPASEIETDKKLIDLNTANLDELDALPGIGQKRAQDIMAGRPYQTFDQLIEKGILSQNLAEEIQKFVTY